MPAPRTFPLAEIAARLGGEVLGNPDTGVSGIATLVSAGPSDISFLVHGRHCEKHDKKSQHQADEV